MRSMAYIRYTERNSFRPADELFERHRGGAIDTSCLAVVLTVSELVEIGMQMYRWPACAMLKLAIAEPIARDCAGMKRIDMVQISLGPLVINSDHVAEQAWVRVPASPRWSISLPPRSAPHDVCSHEECLACASRRRQRS